MPQAFTLLTDSTIEPAAKAGTVVYACSKPDYGSAGDDTRITGHLYISLTLNSDGDYPFFTHRADQVTPV